MHTYQQVTRLGLSGNLEAVTSSISICVEQAGACGQAHVHSVTVWASLISPAPILSPKVWFLSRAQYTHTTLSLVFWVVEGPGL